MLYYQQVNAFAPPRLVLFSLSHALCVSTPIEGVRAAELCADASCVAW
jgi:hypothetical protein